MRNKCPWGWWWWDGDNEDYDDNVKINLCKIIHVNLEKNSRGIM